MTPSQTSASGSDTRRQRRFGASLAAFGIGIPLACGILYFVHHAPFISEDIRRYFSSLAECATVFMFCCALSALVAKCLGQLRERAALRAGLLPDWDGKQVPVSAATGLLLEMDKKPRGLQATFLGRRIAAVLEFLRNRGSAAELDDHLRTLGDTDAMAVEGSYSLTRFLTWAMPILGFLGTVLGITKAISGVSPESLEKNLGQVTGGLSEAFDATALALGLTMIVMFVSSIVERLEHGLLEAVDRWVDHQLAHRFERTGSAGGEFVEVVRQNTQVLVETVEKLVKQQAEIWAKTIAAAEQPRLEAERSLQQRLAASIQEALENTLETHARRLAALEKQAGGQAAVLVERLGVLTKVAQGLAGQTEALTHLQEGERQLLRLQDVLHKNLASLAGAGTFEHAVHSLTAAIHLLTAHSSSPQLRLSSDQGSNWRPGAAA